MDSATEEGASRAVSVEMASVEGDIDFFASVTSKTCPLASVLFNSEVDSVDCSEGVSVGMDEPSDAISGTAPTAVASTGTGADSGLRGGLGFVVVAFVTAAVVCISLEVPEGVMAVVVLEEAKEAVAPGVVVEAEPTEGIALRAVGVAVLAWAAGDATGVAPPVGPFVVTLRVWVEVLWPWDCWRRREFRVGASWRAAAPIAKEWRRSIPPGIWDTTHSRSTCVYCWFWRSCWTSCASEYNSAVPLPIEEAPPAEPVFAGPPPPAPPPPGDCSGR